MKLIPLSERAAANLDRILTEYVLQAPEYEEMDTSHRNTLAFIFRCLDVRFPDA